MKNVILKMLKTLQVRFRMEPRYLPEKHYMRGPGPACAAKARTMRSHEGR